jgi:hypothetical protein
VATVENMTKLIAMPQLAAAPLAQRALTLACATPAADLRTLDVRIDVRRAVTATPAVQGKRIRVSAPTTGMGHVGFSAGYVPGSMTWSPPI